MSAIAMIAMSTLTFSTHIKTSIIGTIDPVDGARKVWAVNGKDSVAASPISGAFTIDVKAGNWKLVVEAVPPYQNTSLDNVVVQNGQTTDIGIIKLTK